MNYLWKLYWDCGKLGEVESIFVATEKEVYYLIGQRIYLPNVLSDGKEAEGLVEEGDIEKLKIDSKTVDMLTEHLGKCWLGKDPIAHIIQYCPECNKDYYEDDFDFNSGTCIYCN